ncbi:hypothetical protein GQX74_007065 [Glossina fuscipes]|nr:hypothetical protein GQX74_007065 [Glossina fuscipes]
MEQVYANLDIVTAKATKEERAKVKHHLLDVATPYVGDFNIRFISLELKNSDRLRSVINDPERNGSEKFDYFLDIYWRFTMGLDANNSAIRGLILPLISKIVDWLGTIANATHQLHFAVNALSFFTRYY